MKDILKIECGCIRVPVTILQLFTLATFLFYLCTLNLTQACVAINFFIIVHDPIYHIIQKIISNITEEIDRSNAEIASLKRTIESINSQIAILEKEMNAVLALGEINKLSINNRE